VPSLAADPSDFLGMAYAIRTNEPGQLASLTGVYQFKEASQPQDPQLSCFLT